MADCWWFYRVFHFFLFYYPIPIVPQGGAFQMVTRGWFDVVLLFAPYGDVADLYLWPPLRKVFVSGPVGLDERVTPNKVTLEFELGVSASVRISPSVDSPGIVGPPTSTGGVFRVPTLMSGGLARPLDYKPPITITITITITVRRFNIGIRPEVFFISVRYVRYCTEFGYVRDTVFAVRGLWGLDTRYGTRYNVRWGVWDVEGYVVLHRTNGQLTYYLLFESREQIFRDQQQHNSREHKGESEREQ